MRLLRYKWDPHETLQRATSTYNSPKEGEKAFWIAVMVDVVYLYS